MLVHAACAYQLRLLVHGLQLAGRVHLHGDVLDAIMLLHPRRDDGGRDKGSTLGAGLTCTVAMLVWSVRVHA